MPAPDPALARYDQAYFDKWYRDPRHRVSTAATVARKASLVLATAEYFLGRPVRSVLDVGCGEGQWQPVLKRLRPAASYLGVDASTYAIAKFGRRRHLLLGAFADLPDLPLADAYDVIVCSDMLYYVEMPALARGLAVLAERLRGVAFLEAYASGEPVEGDTRTWPRRSVGVYRRLFAKLGLVQCGPHCWLRADRHPGATALELAPDPRG